MIARLLNRNILMSLIVFLGIVVSSLTNDYRYLYLMSIGLIITAASFEQNVLKNLWKFVIGCLILIAFIYFITNIRF